MERTVGMVFQHFGFSENFNVKFQIEQTMQDHIQWWWWCRWYNVAKAREKIEHRRWDRMPATDTKQMNLNVECDDKCQHFRDDTEREPYVSWGTERERKRPEKWLQNDITHRSVRVDAPHKPWTNFILFMMRFMNEFEYNIRHQQQQ